MKASSESGLCPTRMVRAAVWLMAGGLWGCRRRTAVPCMVGASRLAGHGEWQGPRAIRDLSGALDRRNSDVQPTLAQGHGRAPGRPDSPPAGSMRPKHLDGVERIRVEVVLEVLHQV